MTKKIILIALGALAVAGVIFLLWWWFFSGVATPATWTGGLGSAGSRQTSGASTGNNQSTGIPLGGAEAGAQNTSGSTGGGPITIPPTVVSGVTSAGTRAGATITTNAPGAVWFSTGTAGTATIGAGLGFSPKPINQIGTSNPSGGIVPTLNIDLANQTSPGNALKTALIAAGIGVGTCSLGYVATEISGLLPSFIGSISPVPVAAGNALLAVPVNDLGTQAVLTGQLFNLNKTQAGQTIKTTFLDCITRAWARAVLAQMTKSIVNWINTGYNGKPSFVTNQQQFFASVADRAAGEYIQGSALSFLCSPFKLQIKIAIAQSYANRQAQSCTLTKVIKDINGFMNGNFSAGGWAGLISFVTVPTNNPYGAYAYAQAGISGAIAGAVGQKQNDLTLGGGFLSFQQEKNCIPTDVPPPPSPNKSIKQEPNSNLWRVCDLVTVTPGSVVAQSLFKIEGAGQDSLNLAKSFDEIISAVVSQLMTKTLYNGLGNLSTPAGGYGALTPDQQQAQATGQALLAQMQGDVQTAQQYGSIMQGSIGDIENVQGQINGVLNCWNAAANNTALPTDKRAGAAANALAASSTIAAYNVQIDSFNSEITRANSAIALLQTLESRALSLASGTDATKLQNDYAAAKASGALVLPADITTAQQNRASLQTSLNSVNQTAATELAQCYAYK